MKYLGDGVMFFFKEPGAAVVSALEMVEGAPAEAFHPLTSVCTPALWCSRTATITGERSTWRRGSPDGRGRTRSW